LQKSQKTLEIPKISISAKEEKGLNLLADEIKRLFFAGNLANNDEIYITNERQKELLKATNRALERVVTSIDNGMPEDFFTIDLIDAYEALGGIIGESIGEDLVNEIFSKFCVGK
jgi:tRNA modification GTPase